MAEVWDLDSLRQKLRECGCDFALIKHLADNDNSKQQIYLAGDVSYLKDIPVKAWGRGDETSSASHGLLHFSWLFPDGEAREADQAKVIMYPQYPELRLSGFLRGANPESEANRVRLGTLSYRAERAYGKRLLILGVDVRAKRVVATLVLDADPAFAALTDFCQESGALLGRLQLHAGRESGDEEVQLLSALQQVFGKGWIPGARIAEGKMVPYDARNSVGYTLEAHLGIAPNGSPLPDLLGYEVKALQAKPPVRGLPAKAITIMTPEPTGGLYVQNVDEFMAVHGYVDSTNPQRTNFGGIYRAGGKPNPHTRLRLIAGDESARVCNSGDLIALIAPDETIAASWHMADLASHWARKHARAVYVTSESRIVGSARQHRFGPTVWLARSADTAGLRDSIASGVVYLDPAVRVTRGEDGKPDWKRRNQFRVSARALPNLYKTQFERRDVPVLGD